MQNKFDQSINANSDLGMEISNDILCLTTKMVNVCFIGKPMPKSGEWVLVDTGLSSSEEKIKEAINQRFGKNSKPRAIILTHGHFDHIGLVQLLTEQWNIPVYAHEEEIPYITGKKDYPPPDPTVGGGLMSILSPIYPKQGINIGHYAVQLPTDGTIPPLPGWKWVHTPGHTPGHISLFREYDRVLIAGDAITTVKQESAIAVLTQHQELHGPPAYFTVDWSKAKQSVKKIYSLKPSVVISSHGKPLSGEKLRTELDNLVENFDSISKPQHGRYIND